MNLGRIHHPDPRDHAFLLKRHLDASITLPNSKLWPVSSVHLDQGPTSTCVGHGWCNFLRCAPIRTKAGEPKAYGIYKKAVLLDPWKANDAEAKLKDGDPGLQSGTTVRAGAQAVVEMHEMQEYSWAFDLSTTLKFLLTKGPVVIGVNWYDSMFDPDVHGVIRIKPGVQISGGHCVCLRGANSKKGLVRGIQSWGNGWGLKGDFFLPYEDLERLIREDGEVCTAIQSA